MKPRKLISFDWAIKKLLRSKANFEILEGFLSELLKTDIRILEILESEQNQEQANDKHSRIDLKVRNTQNEIILIEVQFANQLDYFQRILYGTSKTITEHMDAGQEYQEVIKVISIHILYFDLGQGEDYVYWGGTVFRGIHKHDELQLSSDQQVAFPGRTQVYEVFPEYYLIKVNQFDDLAKDPLDEWIYFLKNEEIQESFQARGLKQAKDRLDIMKLSEPDRKAYEQYLEAMRFQRSILRSSYGVGVLRGRSEGVEIGRQEGVEIGRQEGVEIGRQEGVEIGRQEGVEIGRKEGLIANIQTFQQLLNLPVEDFQELVTQTVDELQHRADTLKQQVLSK